MSEFGARFAAALPRMQRVLGDSCAITLPDQTQITRTCVSFVREAYVPDYRGNGVFHFTESATTGLTVAQALKGMTIAFNGVTWTATDVRRDEDGGWELKCETPELVS